MSIQISKDIFDRNFEYLPQGKVKGRNTLLGMGFEVCGNADYMKRGTRYFHYNKLKGYWIGETPVFTSDNRAMVA